MTTPRQYPRGMKRYAQLYAATLRTPQTAKQLINKLGGHAGATVKLMHALVRVGVMREAMWTRCEFSVRRAPAYSSKPGARAPSPFTGEVSDVVSRRTERVCPEVIAFGVLIQTMREGPATVKQLAEASGCSPDSVWRLMAFGKAAGAFREADWVQREGAAGGPPVACWACDGKPAVPQPARVSVAESRRRSEVKRAEHRREMRAAVSLRSVFAWGSSESGAQA